MRTLFAFALIFGLGLTAADAAGPVLSSRDIRIHFAGADQGFACIGIDNLLVDSAGFCRDASGGSGLWKLEFQTPFQPDRKSDVALLSAREEKNGKTEEIPGGRRFRWSGLDLPDEKGVVDVSVEVTINEKQQSEWRMQVTNRSRKFGLTQSFFPCLPSVFAPRRGDVLVPGPNWGARLVKNASINYSNSYPSGRAPVQFMAFFQGPAGLYYGAQDPDAALKNLILTPQNDVTIGLPAENAAQPGAGRTADFPVVVAACNGDWWEAARMYREWAMTAPWTRKGEIAVRQDYPKDWLEAGYWIMAWGNGDNIRRIVEEARGLDPLPLGIHWYGWTKHPHDNFYPDYPPKDGFGKAVEELTAEGNVIMPYVNGMCWDLNEPSYPSAVPAACKKENGDVYVEVWSARCGKLVTMCPTTEFWQQKVFQFSRELIDKEKINALYVDQITAGPPKLCFDPNHGHPLGGGHFWVDGYRNLLNPLKEYAASQGIPLCSECTAEPYLDNIDIFLTWNGRTDEDVPLLPALYSGYTSYLASPTSEKDTLDAFRVSQGRDFLWGCILGWNGDWILKENQREKFLLLTRLSRLRLKNGDFQIYGQLLDDIRPENVLPTITTVQNNPSPHAMTVPVVQASLWRNRKGELGLFMVNHDSRPQCFVYFLDLNRWLGQNVPEPLALFCGTAEEEVPLAEIRKELIHHTEFLQPHEVRVLTIRPDAGNLVETAENALREAASPEAVRAAQEFLFHRNCEIRLIPERVNYRAVRGETIPFAAEISNPGPAVDIVVTWPDGQHQSITVAGNSDRPQRFLHPFPMPEVSGTSKTEVRELTVTLPGKSGQLTRPVGLEEVPPLSVVFGPVPDLWAGNGVTLPLRIINNSAIRQQDAVRLEVPSDWKISPGSKQETGAVAPGTTKELPVQYIIPAATELREAVIVATVGGSSVRLTLPIRHKIPELTAVKIQTPPVMDGNFADWPRNAAAQTVGGQAWEGKVEGYRGREDCFAQVRCAWDENNFYFAAEVVDDRHCQSGKDGQITRQDSIILAFRDERIPAVNGKFGQNEFVLALNPDQRPAIYSGNPPKSGDKLKNAKGEIRRNGNRTCYEVAIPWEDLKINLPSSGSSYGFSFVIIDSDDDQTGRALEWTPGICGVKDSSRFGKLIFEN